MNFAYVGCAPQIIMPLDGLENVRDTPRGWYRTIHADPTELTRSCRQFRHRGKAHEVGRSSTPLPNQSRAPDSSRTELPDPDISQQGRSFGNGGLRGRERSHTGQWTTRRGALRPHSPPTTAPGNGMPRTTPLLPVVEPPPCHGMLKRQ